MPINTISGMQESLRTYDSRSWAKSADLDIKNGLAMGDAPKLPYENGEVQKTFGEFLTDSISKVNSLQTDANTAVQKLASGESKNIHETLIAVERAEIAFKTMNQIRLKVLDAYKEIMKMQV